MQNLPITASGREPKKPARLPTKIRTAILLMVYGDPATPDKVIDFVEAARRCGVQVDNMRRWLHRPEAAAMLRSERRAYRLALCAANETALARIRDRSENAMAVVKSVQVLNEIDEEDTGRSGRGMATSPGFVIVIKDAPSPPSPAPIDVTPAPEPLEPEPVPPAMARAAPRRR